jgi:hypothetical protein
MMIVSKQEALGRRLRSIQTQLKTLQKQAQEILPSIVPEFTDAIAELDDLHQAYHIAVVQAAETKPYQKGVVAREAGAKWYNNPYEPGSEDAYAYDKGVTGK